jgi:uncharacterized membrane protein YccC
MERIGGTVAGGILAALLAAALHTQLVTAAALFPLALMALAILPVSYAAFAFFLTPTFVLAWLPFTGDWQIALVRTGNTIAGALISVAAMLFLFPPTSGSAPRSISPPASRPTADTLRNLLSPGGAVPGLPACWPTPAARPALPTTTPKSPWSACWPKAGAIACLLRSFSPPS